MELSLLRAHGLVLLLEPLAQALGEGHLLLHAARDAARLAGVERLCREVVDAGHEAVVDEVAEYLVLSEGCVSKINKISIP